MTLQISLTITGSRQMQKYCRTCATWKSTSDFYKSSKSGDGYQPRCKACDKLRKKIDKPVYTAANVHSACDSCAFLRECRYYVIIYNRDAQEPVEPYCFPNSKYRHRYLKKYGRSNRYRDAL